MELKNKHGIVAVIFCLITTSQLLAQSEGSGGVQGIAKAVRVVEASAASRTFRRAINSGLISAAISRSKSAARRPAATSPEIRNNRTGAPAVNAAGPIGVSRTGFVPGIETDYAEKLADLMELSGAERDAAIQIFRVTKDAFEKEVASKNRQNNISSALVFFIASTVTVYHDDPEPADSALDSLWDSMEATLAGSPELNNLSNAEKEEIYNSLIFVSGLVLSFRELAVINRDPDLASQSRSIAGTLIKQTLNLNPEKLRFTKKGLELLP